MSGSTSNLNNTPSSGPDPAEQRLIHHISTHGQPAQDTLNEAQELQGEPITREELKKRYPENDTEHLISAGENTDTSRGSIIEISAILLNATQLRAEISSVSQLPVPPPSVGLQNKARWIHCTVRNETQFTLVPTSTYFGSGRFWDAPTTVGQMSLMVFTASNTDWSISTGVSAGTAFQLILQDNIRIPISLGWTNPFYGSFKAGVVLSPNPLQGYEGATETGNLVETPEGYNSKDSDGNQITVRFVISASPGQYTRFSVTQIIV